MLPKVSLTHMEAHSYGGQIYLCSEPETSFNRLHSEQGTNKWCRGREYNRGIRQLMEKGRVRRRGNPMRERRGEERRGDGVGHVHMGFRGNPK